jgi:hypothetical protein
MNIPRLRSGGILTEHFDKIVNATDNKNNPIPLDKAEMKQILGYAW